MAEGLMKQMFGKHVYVESAGVRSTEVNGFSVEVMDELGIDISGHQSRSFDDLMDTSFDLIVTLSREAQEAAEEMTRTMACDVVYWPTVDPSQIEGSREVLLNSWRVVRDELYDRINQEFGGGPAPVV